MKEWFKARNVWCGAFEALSDAEAGRLAKALWKYTTTGEHVNLTGAEKGCYAMIIYTLQQDEAENSHLSEVRREAGSKGGQQKAANQANANFATDDEANAANATNKNKNNILDDDDDEDDNNARAKIAAEWKTCFGTKITPAYLNKLAGISTVMSVDVIITAIHESASHAPSSPADYVSAVLADWQSEHIQTTDEAVEYIMLRDGADGKIPGIVNPDKALQQLQQFRERKKAS
jgi:hypothetical protein